MIELTPDPEIVARTSRMAHAIARTSAVLLNADAACRLLRLARDGVWDAIMSTRTPHPDVLENIEDAIRFLGGEVESES